MRYGCIIWGNKGSRFRTFICNLQNKAMKIMCFADRLDSSKPLFAKLGIIQFLDVVHLENILFSHAFVTKSLPTSFSEFFLLENNVHRYETRRTVNVFFNVKMVNSTRYGNSIKSLCVTSWNSLLLAHPNIDFQIIKRANLLNLMRIDFINSYKAVLV